MKRIIALTIALILSLSLCSFAASALNAGTTEVNVWDGTTASGFSSGTGLQNDPYIIKTGAELDLLASTCMGGETYADTYFRLEADIDWAGNLWTPIGYDTKNLFAGHFDGNGQTIYNLECFEVYSGLFGAVKEGSIKNLKVDYATFITDTRYCGGIAAWMKLTTVEGVSVGEHVEVRTADIMSNTAQIGGCFGIVHSSSVNGATFYGTVNCTNVTGTSFVGGIAGVVGGAGSIKNCVNYGKVNNVNPSTVADAICYVGGVAGCSGASSDIGTVESCVNYGEVSSVDVAGGVVGRIHVDNSIVKNCYNVGSVKGKRVGTVLGYLSKLYVMEGNHGLAKGDATEAIGDAPGSEDPTYKKPGDSNLKVSSELVITSLPGFIDAEGQAAVLVPIFNLVTPTEPAATTEPETTAALETEPPHTCDPVTTKEEKTEAPEETPAPQGTDAPAVTEAPTTQPPAAKPSGCGGTVSIAAILLCILPVAFISKKD